MRRLMLVMMLLVALFPFIRAYTDEMAAQRAAATSMESQTQALKSGA
jgi:hypothetical protein